MRNMKQSRLMPHLRLSKSRLSSKSQNLVLDFLVQFSSHIASHCTEVTISTQLHIYVMLQTKS